MKSQTTLFGPCLALLGYMAILAVNSLPIDPVLRMLVVSVAFYGMSTFEGPLMSIKSVNSLSHYTDWTVGHVLTHIARNADGMIRIKIGNGKTYSLPLQDLKSAYLTAHSERANAKELTPDADIALDAFALDLAHDLVGDRLLALDETLAFAMSA